MMLWRLLFLFAVLLPTPALAWWEYGHETIAQIAMMKVRPATRTKVEALLRHDRDLATPTCPARTIEQASVWPDCIKGLKERFSYAYNWHYQNVDICQPFDLKAPCVDGNCVSAQVTRNAKLLANKSLPPRERLMALAFLIHFVGDLHQPLHAGDRSDRGGNDQKASYGIVAGPRLNIHSVWDGYLAERAISSPDTGTPGLLIEVSPNMANGKVEDWSRESWQVARNFYARVQGGDPCGPKIARVQVTEDVIRAEVPVVRDQVAKAGARLARLLDAALN